MTRTGLALASFVLVAQGAAGQTASPAPGPRASAPPCASPQHRQFDFWVGDWNVKDSQGVQQGTNLITREFGGCVVQEHWVGAGGMTGGSFNIYTPATKTWHQAWVDTNGTLLLLEGEFKDGRMQLAGEGPRPQGGKRMHRISWEPRQDGTVRQFWQLSDDGGKTWNVAFDGIYERKAGS
jgi:hypothetical protein